MVVTLALAMCLNHGDLAHGCYLELGCVALSWLHSYRGYMALGEHTWACHGHGNMSTSASLALLVACWSVIFQNVGFFQKKKCLFSQVWLFGQASIP